MSRRLILLYILFCGLAMGVNLGIQYAAQFGFHWRFWPSLVVGTGAGLALKFVLDRNFIFQARGVKLSQDVGRFILYSAFGLVTTAIFWAFEWVGYVSTSSAWGRYAGGSLGLMIGYALKYSLDRRWVFAMLKSRKPPDQTP